MAFKPDDMYTVPGTARLKRYWTDHVSKHGTTDYYNWERDNEPLHDLEERTDLLWEQLGYPASSMNGMTLVVSADAPASAIECNPNIFRTLQEAVNAVPKRLSFPVVIEVCSHQQAGGFVGAERVAITDINCVSGTLNGGGSLEIVNRAFAKVYSASSVVNNVLQILPANSDQEVIVQVSSIDLWNTVSATRSTYLNTPVFSGTAVSGDSRMYYTAGYFGLPGYGNAKTTNLVNYSVRPAEVGSLLGATTFPAPNITTLLPYEYHVEPFAEAFFFQPQRMIGGAELSRSYPVANDPVAGAMYFNTYQQISVNNCNGPIILRNFAVGGRTHSFLINYSLDGFSVENSNNIVLENCFAYLCDQNGFNIKNSSVWFSRSVTAYRNYKRYNNAADVIDETIDGAGIRAINSNLYFGYFYGGPADTQASGVDHFINLSRNYIGMDLDSCNLYMDYGPRTVAADPRTTTHFQLENNYQQGILAKSSRLVFNGRLDSYLNRMGMKFVDCSVDVGELTISHNQEHGLHLDNTNFTYGKGLEKYTTFPLGGEQVTFSANGQHLFLDSNSKFEPYPFLTFDDGTIVGSDFNTSANNTFLNSFGKMLFTSPHGATPNDTGFDTPACPVIVANNSYARFVGARFSRSNDSDQWIDGRTVYGALIKSDNNSKAILQGHKDAPTILVGPGGFDNQRQTALAFTNHNSEIEFNGPTVIVNAGVGVLADGNSIAKFNPPKNCVDGFYDVKRFNLSDTGNHTHIEIHASRSCLVAKNGSIIQMEDLGDYRSNWARGSNGLAALAESPEYVTGPTGRDVSAYIHAGSMQFFPNPFDEDYAVANPSLYTKSPDATFNNSEQSPYRYNLADAFTSTPEAGVINVTNGGFCVRALGNSKVKVKNVHFPTGYPNTSGILFDTSGSDCDRLFIWNIADGSYLETAYTSVSALYPADAGYHGPRAIYTSGAGVTAYGAHPSTPDTSSLSVLDLFGSGTNGVWPTPFGLIRYGQDTFNNQGPFRLYVGTKSSAKWLYDLTTGEYGAPYQLFAQGYNPSGNLAASSDASALHYDLMKLTSTGLAPSGFYTASAFVDPGTYARILLDESGANTFANAKNGSAGTSGRPKICTIYNSHITERGEGAENQHLGIGRGFKSVNIFDLDREL